MGSNGTIREAYNAIKDRINSDTNFRNFFKYIDYDRQTKDIVYPYCRIDTLDYSTEPSEVAKIEAPSLTLGVTLIVNPQDDNELSPTLFMALEIFLNAFDGTDPTFYNGSRALVMNTRKSFGGFEQLEPGMIKTEGEIEIELQHYKQGGL